MSLDLTQQLRRLLAFRRERDWEQFHRPKELAAALAIEAGELQEHFLWKEGETAADVRADGQRLMALRGEIADIAIFLVLLSHDLGIDLAEAVAAKVDENERRYTVNDHKGVARKAPHIP